MLGGIAAAEYALKKDTVANAEQLGGVAAGEYATKDYVDTEVSNVEIDLSPYATKDYVEKKVSAYNLLDNSDFRNPIAQAELNGKHGTTRYICDRWLGGNITAEQHEGYLRISTTTRGNQIRQNLSAALQGKEITVACKAVANKTFYIGLYYDANGTTQSIAYSSTSGVNGVVCKTGTVPANATNLRFNIYPAYVDGGGYADIYWAALYEGEYTAETLPPYVPKGYAVELAECQRYYQKYSVVNTMPMMNGICFSETSARLFMFINPMRTRPTATFITSTTAVPYISVNGTTVARGTLSYYTAYTKDANIIEFVFTITDGTTSMPAYLVSNADCYLELSADL